MRTLPFTAIIVLVLTLTSTTAASAQTSAPSRAAPTKEEDEEAIWWPTIRYAWPERLSAGLLFQPPLKGVLSPLMTTFTIGRAGYKAGVGVGWMGGNLAAGYGVQFTVTRTYGEPDGAEPRQTFLGVEGEFMVANISIKAGPAVRVGGRTSTQDRFRLNMSAGFGF